MQQTYTPSDAPGRLEHKLTWRSIQSAVLHGVPGVLVGAMPVLGVWLRLPPVHLLAFCATALALSYGFWRYQRWEGRVVQDWSFLQWGEFVTGAFIGAGVSVLAPVLLNYFL